MLADLTGSTRLPVRNASNNKRDALRIAVSETADFPSPPKREMNAEMMNALGPDPERSLSCLVDLGMTDTEIARYFKLPESSLTLLLHAIRGYNIERYLSA